MTETLTVNPEATTATKAPDLLAALRQSQEALGMGRTFHIGTYRVASTEDRITVPVERAVRPGNTRAVDGFRAVFEWARRQEFDPDYAKRIRREAWGD
jgi:hypothetical protein